MPSSATKKWYQKNISIIVLLVLFFPAGLLLMWKYSNWNKKVKLAITTVFLIFIALGALTDDPQTTNPEVQQEIKEVVEETSKPTTTVEPSSYDIDAVIKFNETAFQITNNENRDWYGCKLELNPGVLKGGYTYQQPGLPAKESIIVPFREFTKGDGTRFNLYDTKAQNLSISCDDVDGKRGFGYFSIN